MNGKIIQIPFSILPIGLFDIKSTQIRLGFYKVDVLKEFVISFGITFRSTLNRHHIDGQSDLSGGLLYTGNLKNIDIFMGWGAR